jgi:VanZ family protein
MTFIFSLSADSGEVSEKKSDSVIVKFTETILHRKLTEVEKEKYIERSVKVVRKTAHFTLYFILGLLIISFLKEFGLSKKSIIISIIVVLLYACSDEIHQTFVAGRSGEVLDVLIDTVGGSLATILYYLIYKRRRFNEQEKTIG